MAANTPTGINNGVMKLNFARLRWRRREKLASRTLAHFGITIIEFIVAAAAPVCILNNRHIAVIMGRLMPGPSAAALSASSNRNPA